MHKFKKRFGQNFLQDLSVIDKIVESAQVKPSEQVWEIGGGQGVLTAALLREGVNLTVFEIDYDLQDYLQKKFCKQITLVKGDILKQDWQKICSPNLKIVANLPYSITSPFLFKVIENIDLFASLTIMIQREVAERIVATPGSKIYGRLSLKMQHYFEVKKILDVKRTSFYPQPKVDSTVIQALPRKNRPQVEDLPLFMRVIDLAFANRRKMLRVNLKQLLPKEKLEKLDFDLTLRGEKLSEADFINLTAQIKNNI